MSSRQLNKISESVTRAIDQLKLVSQKELIYLMKSSILHKNPIYKSGTRNNALLSCFYDTTETKENTKSKQHLNFLYQNINRVKKSNSVNNIVCKDILRLPSIDEKRTKKNSALNRIYSKSSSKPGCYYSKDKTLTQQKTQHRTQINQISNSSLFNLNLDNEQLRYFNNLNKLERAFVFSRMSHGQKSNISHKKR